MNERLLRTWLSKYKRVPLELHQVNVYFLSHHLSQFLLEKNKVGPLRYLKDGMRLRTLPTDEQVLQEVDVQKIWRKRNGSVMVNIPDRKTGKEVEPIDLLIRYDK